MPVKSVSINENKIPGAMLHTQSLTEYGNGTSPSEKNNGSNNGRNIEIMKRNILINGMNTNTEIVQCGEGDNCQENQFAKCFPFVCHEINTSFNHESFLER